MANLKMENELLKKKIEQALKKLKRSKAALHRIIDAAEDDGTGFYICDRHMETLELIAGKRE